MNIKKAITTSALVIFFALVQAHEYWIMPSRFFFEKGESVSLTAMVGENYEGSVWGGGGRNLTSFKHFTANDLTDEFSLIKQDTGRVSITPLELMQEGTHLLAFTTNSQYLSLEPEKFNEYVKEDGLEEVIAYREKNNESNLKSRELYRRCVKVLLQVGNKTDNSFQTKTELVLDIKPLKNPYEYKAKEKPSFQISYDGKAYGNALVRCWHRVNNKTDMQLKRTDKNGLVTFSLPGEGNYMISVVKMDRLKNNEQADWQSTWGSLVFGVRLK
ncbi:MAG: DUF4198 domain-containing protein [Flammeovirgaceae bacterium]